MTDFIGKSICSTAAKGPVKVSVIITNYNYSHYLNRSIRSAFIQNYPTEKYEIIIVDDSSSDWSREIIESYGRYVRSIFLEENIGLAGARNRAIECARGEYILFLDADDYLNRDIVAVEAMYLDFNPDWDAVACDYYLINDDEEIVGRNSCVESPIACGIMFRCRCLVEIGMYDEAFRVHEERELQARFAKKYSLRHIELPLYRYRQHAGSLSRDVDESRKYEQLLQVKHAVQAVPSTVQQGGLARDRVVRIKRERNKFYADHR